MVENLLRRWRDHRSGVPVVYRTPFWKRHLGSRGIALEAEAPGQRSFAAECAQVLLE